MTPSQGKPSGSRQADGYAKPLQWKGGDAYGVHSADTSCSVVDHRGHKKVTAPPTQGTAVTDLDTPTG